MKFPLYILLIFLCILGALSSEIEIQDENYWDYILFVQTWPPSILDNTTNYPYYNNYFTIHGIWPEYLNGGYPVYCNITSFDIVKLYPIISELSVYWTDFINPITFIEHEYYKHYSCAKNDNYLSNELAYFSQGLQLRNELNFYQILKNKNIVPNNNILYKKQYLIDAIFQYIEVYPILTCSNNNVLNQIIICYRKDLHKIMCPNNLYQMECKSDTIIYNTYTQSS